MVPQLLPQNCNHQEESLLKGGKARQKYIACTLCLERCLGVDNFVFWQEPSHASSSVQSPPLQSCPEVLLATKTIRSRPQFRHRVIGLVFQQWRALLLGVFGPLTERLTVELWAKQKQTAWSACQAHNRVQSVVMILVVRPKMVVVQKSCWNGCDLVLSSTEDDLLRELDRPSALWISVPEEPTPATFPLSWSSGSSLARCASSLVSMQKCVPAVNPTCADSALGV